MYADQIAEARALATPYGQNITAMDTTPAIAIQYVPDFGAGGAGSTSVGKAKITTDGIRFKVDDSTPAGNDALANQTSSGWLTFASQTNMGQMLDAINNGGLAWRAIPKCMLRGDIASNLLAASETVVSNANGKVFFWDSKAETLIVAGAVVSGERFINNGKNGHVKDSDDEVENTIMYIEANIVDSDMTLTFYSSTATADTQIGGALAFTAAGSATYFGKNDPEDPYISAQRGARLIARVTTLTQQKGTPTRFHVLGKSAVLKNDRIVEDVQVTN